MEKAMKDDAHLKRERQKRKLKPLQWNRSLSRFLPYVNYTFKDSTLCAVAYQILTSPGIRFQGYLISILAFQNRCALRGGAGFDGRSAAPFEKAWTGGNRLCAFCVATPSHCADDQFLHSNGGDIPGSAILSSAISGLSPHPDFRPGRRCAGYLDQGRRKAGGKHFPDFCLRVSRLRGDHYRIYDCFRSPCYRGDRPGKFSLWHRMGAEKRRLRNFALDTLLHRRYCGAVIIGVPIGILTAVFLSETAPKMGGQCGPPGGAAAGGYSLGGLRLFGMLIIVPRSGACFPDRPSATACWR